MSRHSQYLAGRDAAADQTPHPVCRACGYDLIGSVRAKRRICPECGRKFSRYEVAPGAPPWTFWRGLRGAAWVLGLRGLAAVPLCFLLSLLMIPGLAAPPYGGLLLLLAVAGLGLGAWLGRDLVAYAGRRSLALTALATASAWTVVAGSVGPAVLVRPVDGWTEIYALHTTAIFATFWILRATALDD